MITEIDLKAETEEFFLKYWKDSNGDKPIWKFWDFNSEIFNQGCYAIFNESELIYIGVAIGNNSGKYIGKGLAARLKRYYQLNNDSEPSKRYKPKKLGEVPITGIMTFGFTPEHYWLAAALEIFLINKLNPPQNAQHKK